MYLTRVADAICKFLTPPRDAEMFRRWLVTAQLAEESCQAINSVSFDVVKLSADIFRVTPANDAIVPRRPF